MDKLKAEPLRLMVAIVDRGKGTIISGLCDRNHLAMNFICFGRGTADSELLSLLGLGSSEKDLVVSLIPDSKIPLALRAISMRMNMRNPGRGIAFTIPLSGVNALIARVLAPKEEEREAETKPERRKVGDFMKFSIVAAIYNSGHSDQVIKVARDAGATGGTIINARGVNEKTDEKFFGMSIQEEKEIILILTPDEAKKPIMEALNSQCGLKTESQAIVLSLPVEDMVGI